MASPSSQPLRIFYAAGPGNVIGTFRHWRQGEDDPTQVARTYSGQFFDVCRKLDARAMVIAWPPQSASHHDDGFTVLHRPRWFAGARGPFYHLSMICHGLRMIASAARFRADFAVMSDGAAPWFLLPLLPIIGIRVIPALHCVLWPQSRSLANAPLPIRRGAAPLFRRWALAILSASHDISGQIALLTGGAHRPIIEFFPTFRPQTFEDLPRADVAQGPFRVLYAGRIEENKGVFHLVEIARQCADQLPAAVRFDICGEGSALEALRQAAADAGLQSIFHLHGHLRRDAMRSLYAASHAVIVPTTTHFVEGFNQVVVEAILSRRPCITSSVCPALEYVRDAVVEVPPDDVGAYVDAVVNLATDAALYDRKVRACESLREPFFDERRSWAAALEQIIRTTRHDDNRIRGQGAADTA